MAAQDDDDGQSDISTSSTIEECTSDQEYNVEDVLAEEVVPYDNVKTRCYLIRWTGYDTHDWTWEPKDAQSEGIHELWKWRKESIKKGKLEEYNVATWKRARKEHLRAKLSRHKKRNAKRKRLGLGTTVPNNEVLEALRRLSYYPGGNDTDDDPDDDYIKARQAKLSPRSKARVEPGKHGSTSKKPTMDNETNNASMAQTKKPSRDSIAKDEQSRKGSTTPAAKDAAPPKTTITGYQGTARSKPHGMASNAVGDRSATTRKHGTTTLPAGKKTTSASKPVSESRVSGSINVFGGGGDEPRRKRAVDYNKPGVEGHHFSKFSSLRRAQKTARGKEDAAPSGLIRLHRVGTARDTLVAIANPADDSPVAVTPTTSSTASRPSKDHESPTADKGGSPLSLTRTSLASPLLSRDYDEPNRPAKRAKTVRWPSPGRIARVTTFEYQDKDEEDGLFCGPPAHGEQRTTAAATFGSRPSQRVTCIFESRVTCGQTSTWNDLLSRAHETLAFSHSCEARILISTLPSFRSESLPYLFGVVVGKSKDDKDKLQHVANRLKANATGLLSYHEDLVILVYPNPIQCEWEELETSLNIDKITVVEAVPLKFHAFKINGGGPPLELRPGETARLAGFDTGQNSSKPLLMDLFFDLSYGNLVPSKALNEPAKQNIMFVCPDSEQSLARPMMQWLESCNPQCNIFMANLNSHWQYFLGLPSGVVIIHSEVLPWLRSFPDIRRLLRTQHSDFRFYVIPAAPVPSRLFLDPEECIRDVSEPSRLPMKEIFTEGYIFLLTPSFLLSQPRDAYVFLKWFQVLWSRCRWMWGLAVAHDFDTFMLQTNINDKRDPDCRELTQHKLNLWMLMQDLADRGFSNHRPLPSTDSRTPLTYASPLINAADEQSLVNWFGAWSLMNVHRFRRFYVLGSKATTEPTARTTTLPLPCYMARTVNDPDASCPESAGQGRDAVSQNMPPGPTGPSRLGEALNGLCQLAKPSFLFIYNKVVGYVDSEMASLHKDPTTYRMDTYESWFKTYDPKYFQRRKANTFVGLFLTPPEQADNTGYHPVRSPGRFGDYADWHPWVAMYRSFMGKMGFGEMELLLWDPHAAEKYGHERPSTVAYNELLCAQRKLIDIVVELTPSRAIYEQGGGRPELKHVWFGGFGSSATLANGQPPPANAIDRCVSFIEEDIKDTTPLYGDALRARGYSYVDGQRAHHFTGLPRTPGLMTCPTTGSDKSDVRDDFDMTVGKLASYGKLYSVYHPPRSRHGWSVSSNCKNMLYDQARAARSRGTASQVTFTYQPTMKWWETQEKEGRDFQHITVVPGTVDKLMAEIDASNLASKKE